MEEPAAEAATEGARVRLPQTSFNAAKRVATVLRGEGYSCVITGDDDRGWVVEIIGYAAPVESEVVRDRS